MTPSLAYRFGTFHFDPATGELRRSGVRIHLALQPLTILQLLLERAPALVTRAEVRAALWQDDHFVEYDTSINSAIRQLRRTLGDDGHAPRYIETLPRRGYRFLAPVEVLGAPVEMLGAPMTAVVTEEPEPEPLVVASDAPQPRRRFTLAPAIAVVALLCAIVSPTAPAHRVVEERTSIALRVAPFTAIGKPCGYPYDRAIAAEVADVAARLQPSALAVVDRGHRGEAVVVDATIVCADSSVRVFVRATDRRARRIWSATYESSGKPSDVVVEVGQNSARGLARQLLKEWRYEPPLPEKVDRHALALYAEARREAAKSFQHRKFEREIDLFAQAAAKAPHLDAAHSGMAEAYASLAVWRASGEQRRAMFAKAREAARRALSTNPRNAEAHQVLGSVAFLNDFDRSAAAESLRRAVERAPEYSEAHDSYARVLTTMGRHDEAVAHARRAAELDLHAEPSSLVGWLLFLGRRYEEALVELNRVAAAAPERRDTGWELAAVLAAKGAKREALLTRLSLMPQERGTPIVQELDDDSRQRFVAEYYAGGYQRKIIGPYTMAAFLAEQGEYDRALDLLEDAAAERAFPLLFCPVDPRFDGMRNHVRYRTILARVGL